VSVVQTLHDKRHTVRLASQHKHLNRVKIDLRTSSNRKILPINIIARNSRKTLTVLPIDIISPVFAITLNLSSVASGLYPYLEDSSGLGLGVVINTGEMVVVLQVRCYRCRYLATYPFHLGVLVPSTWEVESDDQRPERPLKRKTHLVHP